MQLQNQHDSSHSIDFLHRGNEFITQQANWKWRYVPSGVVVYNYKFMLSASTLNRVEEQPEYSIARFQLQYYIILTRLSGPHLRGAYREENTFCSKFIIIHKILSAIGVLSKRVNNQRD
jgi:hypothetical protein